MSKFQRPNNTTANPRWFDAETALDIVPVLDNDAADADRFVKLAGHFVLTQGGPDVAGRRFSEVWTPWQAAALRAMYQSRESFLLMGKGSGKSTMLAAFAIAYVMLAAIDKKNTRSQVVIVASSVSTARIIFDHIMMCILSDEELRPLWKSNAQYKSVGHIESGITIQVLACAMTACVGLRPLLTLVDELHETSFIGDSTQALQQLRAGGANWGKMAKVISISTMPPGESVGEFARLLSYARQVRDGTLTDPDFLPLIFEFPLVQRPDLSPDDPAEWWRGMPNLRTATQPGTMDAEEVKREIEMSVKADNKEQFNLVMSQRLGIPADLRDSTAESILRARWPNCLPIVEPIPSRGTITIGIDAGGLDDPMAVAVIWKSEVDARAISVVVEQHLVKTGYVRAPSYLQQVYDEAIKAGTLFIHQSTDDLERAVIARCLAISRANNGSTVCGGDEHGRAGFKARFETEGGMTFKSVPQSWQLGSALRSLEGRLDDGQVRHSHCPLTAFNVRSLLIEETATGNLVLKKRDAAGHGNTGSQGRMKIDGIVAAVNAVFLMDASQHLSADVTWMVA